MPRLVVIDAANTLYRAFFAIPNLRSTEGLPTGAVYGLANMLRKVIREERPDAVVVAQDPPGGSFRRELYPDCPIVNANIDDFADVLAGVLDDPDLRTESGRAGVGFVRDHFDVDDVNTRLLALYDAL